MTSPLVDIGYFVSLGVFTIYLFVEGMSDMAVVSAGAAAAFLSIANLRLEVRVDD